MRTALALVLLAACAPEEPLPLVDPEAWTPVERADDPLADHRPEDDACPSSSWGAEDGALEVQTGYCHYAAFSQPLPVDLRERDRLTGLAWYADLDAAEPAEGHLAILVGDEVVWEAVVAIPGPADVLSIDVPAIEAPAGTPIGVHLHNHGYNTWKVGDLIRG